MENEKVVKPKSRRKKIIFVIILILLLLALLYYFTYYLANKNQKVIYQDSTRRIYLNSKKEYKPGRFMWRMVYEDLKNNKRFFVLGNSLKNFPDKKMAEILLNTIDQGKARSYDTVQQAGVLIKEAKTDGNANLIPKKGLSDFIDAQDFENIFPAI